MITSRLKILASDDNIKLIHHDDEVRRVGEYLRLKFGEVWRSLKVVIVTY